ncbi:Unknown protein [Striga hermonthica]|uniref:Uncharacterized protein n=1 Tax=Striga hermonthica TaxID=68872 RepID=A0A9N7R9U9_STRHE|nr:Unknown protein [Striga hermonthica]
MEGQQTNSFVPVIARLDRLERVLLLLEEKHNNRVSKRDESDDDDDFGTAAESNNGCKTLSSALEEVQQKGTLLHRLALLENRVLQLSLEMDEGNTSKSSLSTVELSENNEKRFEMFVPNNDMPVDQPAAGTYKPKTQVQMAEVFVKEIASQHKGGQYRKKSKTRWPLGLLRLGC